MFSPPISCCSPICPYYTAPESSILVGIWGYSWRREKRKSHSASRAPFVYGNVPLGPQAIAIPTNMRIGGTDMVTRPVHCKDLWKVQWVRMLFTELLVRAGFCSHCNGASNHHASIEVNSQRKKEVSTGVLRAILGVGMYIVIA